MANTHVGWAEVPIFAGSIVKFDQIASLIAAGSAAGGAYEGGASQAFPRAASLHQAQGTIFYPFDTLLFRSSATSCVWTTDPLGTAGPSSGIQMFASDPRSVIYPSDTKNFQVAGVAGSGVLAMIFLAGNDLNL